MSRRILVTGSRIWNDMEWVWQILDEFVESGDTIIHGNCDSGADHFAELWYQNHKDTVNIERYPADWHTYGKSAGPIRNQHMVATGADICIGFPLLGSRGSWNCMSLAEKAGIPVYNMGETYDAD